MTNRMHIDRTWRGMACIAVILCQLSLSTASAQTDPEYRMEIGGGVGLMTYLGDFNNSLLKSPGPMFSVLAKYKPNPRMAMGLTVSYGRYKGEAKGAGTYYPASLANYKFTHGLVDVQARYELNFWPYGTGQDYRGAKRLTPYIYIGLGMTIAQPDQTELGVNMPIGGGVKYKIAPRLNLTAEWTMHLTGNDRLDGMKDPYDIPSSGLFKNTDCYSSLRIAVSYDLWAKCRTCHNDRD